jgi:site-specific DNA-methyltransferase (adenine-specific)
MKELTPNSVQLIVTSPPYWQLKDYGASGQIGFDDSYEEYIANLNQVWTQCYRVLSPGCRLCINIGDQFARAAYYGRYKVIPIREKIVHYCEALGFDYMGAIIWQKATTMNTSGGGSVMGSFPHPRNGILKIDYEFILIFKKLGNAPKVTPEQKAESAMTTAEWNTYFSGHWNFGGEKQGNGHIAMFPVELPRRLIKMFSFAGERVLDPFAGSGTTIRAARELNRIGVGYEINRDFEPAIRKRLGLGENELFPHDVEFIEANLHSCSFPEPITPLENGLQRQVNPKEFRFGSVIEAADMEKPKQKGLRVREILSPTRLQLNDGGEVILLGVEPLVDEEQKACDYLNKLVKGKNIFLKFSGEKYANDGVLRAYVYLENKTFINAKLIKLGLVQADENTEHHYARRFKEYSSHV